MNNTSKVFFIITSIFIFSFLVFTTYVTGNYSIFQKPEIIENIENKDIKISKIDNFNDIYIVSGSTNINENKVNIEKGIYIFDINYLNKDLNIEIKGYNIIPESEGLFILNTKDENNTIIYSINSTLKIEILDLDNNIVNNIYIYPNNLVSNLNYNKNNRLKNTDLKATKNRINFYYIEKKLKDFNDYNDSLKKIIGSNDEKIIKSISDNINYIIEIQNEREKNLNNFYKSNFGTIIGEDIIKKYSELFVNKSKKNIYYKNIIIKTFVDLIKTDSDGKKEINLIEDTYNELNKISNEGAKEIKNYINHYSKSIFSSNLFGSTKKESINYLLFKINNSKSELKNNKLIKTYFDFNFKGLKLNSKIIKENHYNFKNINNNEYYSKNIQDIFLKMLKMEEYNIYDINNILSIYLESSESYFISEEIKEVETGLNNYINIYKNLEPIFRKTFFEKERDSSNLLILKKIDINRDEIKSLEKNISKLFNTYNQKSDILNKSELKNILNEKVINSKNELFKEYFSALNDKDDYKAKYDKSKKDLLYGDSINNSNEEKLDINKIKKYLEKFNGVNFNNIDIKIRNYNYCKNPIAENIDNSDQYCYEIRDLIAGNNNISFILSPFESNKLDNLVINGDPNINKGSYKLDKQEEILEEKLKAAQTEEKNKYLFSNFFLMLFNEKNYQDGIEIVNNNSDKLEEEDTVIKVFKRNKLLGTKGDFYSISDFLEIKYDDLKVTSNGNNYDIFIQNSSFEKSLEGNINIKGILNSSYSFNPDHSFINPELTFIDRNGYKLFNGNEIKIEGKYNVEKIDSELDILFKNIKDLEQITRKISIKYGNNYSIKYFKETNIYQIDIEGNIVELKGNIVTKTIFSGIESDINESINNFNFQ